MVPLAQVAHIETVWQPAAIRHRNGLRLRPMLLLGLVFILVALQFISLGLIAELVVARKLETTGEEIIKAVHPHPTMSEAVMEAAAAAYGEVIHI